MGNGIDTMIKLIIINAATFGDQDGSVGEVLGRFFQ
jgi:hypothetical protein